MIDNWIIKLINSLSLNSKKYMSPQEKWNETIINNKTQGINDANVVKVKMK